MFESIKIFRRKLKSGQFCVGAAITLSDPAVIECLGKNADVFWIDLEHTSLSLESVQSHLIAARAVNVPALVRVPTSDVGMIKRVADTGASGIIVPQIRSAEEVRHVVSACRYSPLGNRGFGPRRASNYGQYDSDAYIEMANKEFFVCVQIENVEALNDLEAILKVRHLDCIVIGPYDLSASMGVMGRVRHPRVVKAIATVIMKAKRAGLYVGMGMGTEEELAVEAAAMGANWVQCGSDFGYMIKSAGELFGSIRKRALAQSKRTTGAPKSPG